MKRILLFGLVLSAMVSCRKTPDLSQLTNNFVVITNRDANANFPSYDTYHISDTVTQISNVASADSIITGPVAATLVNAVKAQMNARGYTFKTYSQGPDLGIRLTVLKQLQVGVVYPPGWWWGWWGYPGGCYYGCYPPYWGYPVAYSYNVGDLILEMIDVKNSGSNHNLKRIWIANIGGVLSSTSQTNLDMAVSGINTAFAQSSYISSN